MMDTKRTGTYAVMGATGQTGGAALNILLERGARARAIVRDEAKGLRWADRGAEIAIADATDVDALESAFEGCAAVYVMNPPAYMEPDLFARSRKVHSAVLQAAGRAGVGRLVALSSIGGQHAKGTGNIATTHDLEVRLSNYEGAATILRAANFMENWAWSMGPVREAGVLPSMFEPLDRAFPMVSAQDVGTVAADLMLEAGSDKCIVELRGPKDYSANDAAAELSRLLGRPVQAAAVSRAARASVFEQQGMPPVTVEAFVEMYDGFNSGLIAFEGGHDTRRGDTTLREALVRVIVGSIR
ncbi:MAG: NAD(P)H-binding protein [Pyrinomonadaceae bacterium]